jgi:hypothetical protein
VSCEVSIEVSSDTNWNLVSEGEATGTGTDQFAVSWWNAQATIYMCRNENELKIISARLTILSKLKDCGQWLIGQSCLILPMPSHSDEYGELLKKLEEEGEKTQVAVAVKLEPVLYCHTTHVTSGNSGDFRESWKLFLQVQESTGLLVRSHCLPKPKGRVPCGGGGGGGSGSGR